VAGRRPLRNWSFTQKAFRDFEAIVDYLRSHAVDREGSEKLLKDILAACNHLGEQPHSGTPRKDLRPTLRSVAVNPYTIYHRVIRGRVQISRILHQRQDAARIFRKRR
jgi:plasmid stabilization system protein ParE